MRIYTECWRAIGAPLIVSILLNFTGFAVRAATPSATPATTPTVTADANAAAAAPEDSGLAAVYSDRLNGHRTASGRIYHRNGLTAAHKTLPFGTRIKVTDAATGKSVTLTVDDRGPKQAGRILDITPRAAHLLGMPRSGLARVTVQLVGTATR